LLNRKELLDRHDKIMLVLEESRSFLDAMLLPEKLGDIQVDIVEEAKPEVKIILALLSFLDQTEIAFNEIYDEDPRENFDGFCNIFIKMIIKEPDRLINAIESCFEDQEKKDYDIAKAWGDHDA
jgi:hypothetical protein